jgi:hypothetical protein
MLRLHFGGPLQFKAVRADLISQRTQAIALNAVSILLPP